MKKWRDRNKLPVALVSMAVFCLFTLSDVMAKETEVMPQDGAETQYRHNVGLETITVTAEKREEDIQDVPVSITALSSLQIEDAGISTISDISTRIPNLTIFNWGSRSYSFVFVRGIGATKNEPAIGFYVDDVNYLSSGVFDTNLFDIERIEVLRGPQGTLYGRNSLGGVINIITRKPDNEFHSRLTATAGNFNKAEVNAALRAPVVKDKLFLGLSAMFAERDGYIENDFLNRDMDYRESFSGRGMLRWLPNDRLDFTLNLDGEKINDGVFPLTTWDEVKRRPFHVNYDFEGENERDIFGSSLRAVYEAPLFKLTSITAWREWQNDVSFDPDFTPLKMFTGFVNSDNNQLTQELRFSSHEGDTDLKWLFGAYYFKNNSEVGTQTFNHQSPGGRYAFSDLTSEGYAFFGQATYTLFNKLDLTAGLRYDHEDKDMDHASHLKFGGMVVPGSARKLIDSEDYQKWLPKFGVSYRWTPQIMSYASITKGYRAGGFNYYFIDPADVSFAPEFSWNYEVGAKSSWFDNRLILNAAMFYIDLKEQQLTHMGQMGGRHITITRNAGESHSLGFEVETIIRPINGLELEAGLGYVNAQFDEYKDAGIDYKDKRTPLVPEYTYNIAAQYRHPLISSFELFGKKDVLDFFGRVELLGVGQSYWDYANELEQKPYELVNLRVGLETKHLDLVLWCKNLFDTEHEAFVLKFLGRPVHAQPGDPRTIGITMTGRF